MARKTLSIIGFLVLAIAPRTGAGHYQVDLVGALDLTPDRERTALSS